MPRIYKPKNNRRIRVDENLLQKAVAAVLKGDHIKTTARHFGLPVMTVKRYARKQKASDKLIHYGPVYGSSSRAFTDEEEKMLQDYVLKASKLHHGLTPLEVRKLAYQFAFSNNKPALKKWTQGIASYEWYYGFMRRRKCLSLRKPQATSLSRATSFNKHNVGSFFENLRSTKSRYNFGASDMWNLDETGVTTVHEPNRIVAGKGSKQVSKTTSGERGELVTVCCAVNAAGSFIPPFMIFPRKNWQDRMLNNCYPGTVGTCHPSGWMTAENFVKFLQHFSKHVRCSNEKPCLIIMDNHGSHISVDAISYAKANGIHLLTIPPHTSHKLQPLDRTVYGPLKSHYNRACDDWMTQHAGKTMTIYAVAECFCKAFAEAFTTKNIMSGFRTTGIHPFNTDIFTDDDFLSSYVTDRPEPEITELTAYVVEQQMKESTVPVTVKIKQEDLATTTTVATAIQRSSSRTRRRPARFLSDNNMEASTGSNKTVRRRHSKILQQTLVTTTET